MTVNNEQKQDFKSYVSFGVDLVQQVELVWDFFANLEKVNWIFEENVLKYAIYRYEKYWLPLAAKSFDRYGILPAPIDVELVWQVHILNFKQYIEDTKKIIGFKLDHRLFLPAEHHRYIADSRQLWESSFYNVDFELNSSKYQDYEIPSDYQSQLFPQLQETIQYFYIFRYQVSLPHMKDPMFIGRAKDRYKFHIYQRKFNQDIYIPPTYDIAILQYAHMMNTFRYIKDIAKISSDYFRFYDPLLIMHSKFTEENLRIASKVWQEIDMPYYRCGAMFRGEPYKYQRSLINDFAVQSLDSYQVNSNIQVLDYNFQVQERQKDLEWTIAIQLDEVNVVNVNKKKLATNSDYIDSCDPRKVATQQHVFKDGKGQLNVIAEGRKGFAKFLKIKMHHNEKFIAKTKIDARDIWVKQSQCLVQSFTFSPQMYYKNTDTGQSIQNLQVLRHSSETFTGEMIQPAQNSNAGEFILNVTVMIRLKPKNWRSSFKIQAQNDDEIFLPIQNYEQDAFASSGGGGMGPSISQLYALGTHLSVPLSRTKKGTFTIRDMYGKVYADVVVVNSLDYMYSGVQVLSSKHSKNNRLMCQAYTAYGDQLPLSNQISLSDYEKNQIPKLQNLTQQRQMIISGGFQAKDWGMLTGYLSDSRQNGNSQPLRKMGSQNLRDGLSDSYNDVNFKLYHFRKNAIFDVTVKGHELYVDFENFTFNFNMQTYEVTIDGENVGVPCSDTPQLLCLGICIGVMQQLVKPNKAQGMFTKGGFTATRSNSLRLGGLNRQNSEKLAKGGNLRLQEKGFFCDTTPSSDRIVQRIQNEQGNQQLLEQIFGLNQ